MVWLTLQGASLRGGGVPGIQDGRLLDYGVCSFLSTAYLHIVKFNITNVLGRKRSLLPLKSPELVLFTKCTWKVARPDRDDTMIIFVPWVFSRVAEKILSLKLAESPG